VNGVETDESHRTWTLWEDQDAQAYGNLMLRISANIRKLAIKAKMDNTRELLDWLKMQYGTTSISAAYADIVAITNGHLLICNWCFRILKGSKMQGLDSDKRYC